jgi:hypothetical protein
MGFRPCAGAVHDETCTLRDLLRLPMNPSPLIPLPIGWGEGKKCELIGHIPRNLTDLILLRSAATTNTQPTNVRGTASIYRGRGGN